MEYRVQRFYLVVENPAAFYSRAIAAGARELSPLALRDWGHTAAYCLDPDGHVLAFATSTDAGLSGRTGTNEQ